LFSRLKSIRHLLKSTLARNTVWMLVGQGLKLVIQALYFTVIARSLGAQNYGAFVGVVGLVGILSPFGSLGSGYVLIKNVARERRSFNESFGVSLLTTFCSSSLLFGLVVLVSHLLLPNSIPTRLVVLVAAADLFGTNFTAICGQAFLAFERLQWTAGINVLLSSIRLVAAIILTARHPNPSALQWGSFYFGSTSVTAIAALAVVLVKLGIPKFSISQNAAEIREGVYFSVCRSAETIYNDIDKTMLARLGTLEATGIYGAAYRLIDVSFAPVWSLLAANYSRLFRVGVEGISAAVRYARPLIFRAFGYAASVSLLLLAGAGLVPYVLGSEYRLTVEALRWLAVLPILKVAHFFLSDVLAAAGHIRMRTFIQITVAVFNVLINLWLIPAYSWRGAAWSSIASDGLLACGVGAAVLFLSRRPQNQGTEVSTLEVSAET
jgi:O-antigen/teichoic acid export membrane protein